MHVLLSALFAAHQGEEFVIILPAIMLLGAFFILRWANAPNAEETDDSPQPGEVAASDDDLVESGDGDAEQVERPTEVARH